MAKPAIVKRLVKGLLIDAQEGFVDTFNYLVDFIENLRGEGDEDYGKSVTVDRSTPDAPVIRLNGNDGGGSPTVTKKKFGLICGDDSNIAFTPTINIDPEDPDKVSQVYKIDVYYT